jgi:hypothetical protein
MSIVRLSNRTAVICVAAAMATFCAMNTAQAQTGAASDSRGQVQQPSPQGQTGPLTTGSGGAPPETPAGETPPNMQSTPSSSPDAPKGK